MTATGVEAVRGVQVVCRVAARRPASTSAACACCTGSSTPTSRSSGSWPTRTGLYRLPEPKILTGTNYCDVGFALDEPIPAGGR